MSPSTNKKTYYNMGNCFDFLRIRNEPVEMRDVGSVLIFSEHRRTVLLEEYVARVEKQNGYNRKKKSRRPQNRIWAPTLPLSLSENSSEQRV